jgi:hypothetical protein
MCCVSTIRTTIIPLLFRIMYCQQPGTLRACDPKRKESRSEGQRPLHPWSCAAVFDV